MRKVLIFSDNKCIRDEVAVAVSGKIGEQDIEVTEVATAEIAVEKVTTQEFDLLIFDAQTYKDGAMSVAKRLEYEYQGQLPPILMLVERVQDAWLSAWAGATKVVTTPVKPTVLRQVVADLLKES